MGLPGELFGPSPKNEKNPPWKKFSIFQEMELSGSNIKKKKFFSKKKLFLDFGKRKHWKKFFIFQETELSYISEKVYSEPWHNRTFLYISERYIQNTEITELIRRVRYIQKVYSEYCQISMIEPFFKNKLGYWSTFAHVTYFI